MKKKNPLMGMRCQENGERAGPSWPPPLLPGPVLKGLLLGVHGLWCSPPTLIQPFPLSLWLALLDRRGVPISGLMAHGPSSPRPLQTQPVSPEFVLQGISSHVRCSLPTSLADALRHGLAGSSQGQSGLFAFCSEAALAPFPFPRSPGLQVPPVDAGGRRVAGSSCPLSLGDPLAWASHVEDGCHHPAGTCTRSSRGWIWFLTMNY